MRLGRFGQTPGTTDALMGLCRELHSLESEDRRALAATFSPGTLQAIHALDFEWLLWARPEQLAPAGEWRWWVMAGGRGGGKTRAAAEQVIEWAWAAPGHRICLLGRDAGSVRRVMVRGDSGIMRRSPPWFKPRWYKTDKLLVWARPGHADTVAELHSAEEPDTLRGPQYHKAWVTELFHHPVPRNEREPEAWREGIKLTLRLGDTPQGIIDSSPSQTEFCADFLLGEPDENGDRPVSPAQIESGEWELVHQLTDHEGREHTYRIVCRRWSSERNAANISPGVVAEWRHDLAGTALERQELDGLILAKVSGALWSQELLSNLRVVGVPAMRRVLVAVDPTRSDAPRIEAGIVVGGLGVDGVIYVWDDVSLRGSPSTWGATAIAARNKYAAEAIVLEKNRLEASTRETLRALDPKVRWLEVQAADGKRTRAEPISALYEQGRVRHVRDLRDPNRRAGRLAMLEHEMTNWAPGSPSPNRMDALVWLVWALAGLDDGARVRISM